MSLLLQGYLATMCFASSLDDSERAQWEAAGQKVSADLARQSELDCTGFFEAVGHLIPVDRLEEAGRDLWFTRNHHGVGFWDGGWSDVPDADAFAAEARALGEVETFLNDDLELDAI